uniref:Uncharacterized protein n=1 Tax=Arion vulgaris TaxID=1028688 RepID=A0A0B6ZPY3_9EUPU
MFSFCMATGVHKTNLKYKGLCYSFMEKEAPHEHPCSACGLSIILNEDLIISW